MIKTNKVKTLKFKREMINFKSKKAKLMVMKLNNSQLKCIIFNYLH